jgi:uncharacterized protein YxeA
MHDMLQFDIRAIQPQGLVKVAVVLFKNLETDNGSYNLLIPQSYFPANSPMYSQQPFLCRISIEINSSTDITTLNCQDYYKIEHDLANRRYVKLTHENPAFTNYGQDLSVHFSHIGMNLP